MSPAAPPDRRAQNGFALKAGFARQAGFTLIEVLVALAVAAAVLGSVAALMGQNARAARRLEERAALLAVARAVEAGIPPRSALQLGRIEGAVAGHHWTLDVRPRPMGDLPSTAVWVPRDLVIRVRAPSGAMVELTTVRLVRREGG